MIEINHANRMAFCFGLNSCLQQQDRTDLYPALDLGPYNQSWIKFFQKLIAQVFLHRYRQKTTRELSDDRELDDRPDIAALTIVSMHANSSNLLTIFIENKKRSDSFVNRPALFRRDIDLLSLPTHDIGPISQNEDGGFLPCASQKGPNLTSQAGLRFLGNLAFHWKSRVLQPNAENLD
jgi:hypothetical protein